MPRYALKIEYHGAAFSGWQIQVNQPTVQGQIERAAQQVMQGTSVRVQGAGRTDSGVHATGQVAHLDTPRDWSPPKLADALNHFLMSDQISILAAAQVRDDFHARFSATARHYIYRMETRRAPLALNLGLAWHRRRPMDINAMRQAAAYLLGQHDFTTFRSVQCQAQSPVKTLDHLEIRQNGDQILFDVRARSFLHNQVRSFVGTLDRVGTGAWPPEKVRDALEARDRQACGPLAPSHGLYLTHVVYPDDPFS